MPPNFPPEEAGKYNIRPEAQLAILITEGLKRNGLTVQKLSEISGIAVKNIQHMIGGDIKQFPSAPFLRSYIVIIGNILEFDGQALWEKIKVDELAIRSGKKDRFPYSKKTAIIPQQTIWTSFIILCLAIYLFIQFPKIIGIPELIINIPFENTTTTDTSSLIMSGLIKNGDEFFVNGEPVILEKNGSWEKNIELQEGINTIEFKAKKFLGQEVRTLRQIIYTPTGLSTKKDIIENSSNSLNSSSTLQATSSPKTNKEKEN